jgi:hypothetical protein
MAMVSSMGSWRRGVPVRVELEKGSRQWIRRRTRPAPASNGPAEMTFQGKMLPSNWRDGGVGIEGMDEFAERGEYLPKPVGPGAEIP